MKDCETLCFGCRWIYPRAFAGSAWEFRINGRFLPGGKSKLWVEKAVWLAIKFFWKDSVKRVFKSLRIRDAPVAFANAGPDHCMDYIFRTSTCYRALVECAKTNSLPPHLHNLTQITNHPNSKKIILNQTRKMPKTLQNQKINNL